MKNTFYYILVLLYSCSGSTVQEKAPVEKKIEQQTIDVHDSFYVENEKDYAPNFLNGLKKMGGFEKVQLINNLMVFNEKDTMRFPKKPKQNYELIFTGKADNLGVILTIRRINKTSIEYQAELAEFGKWTYLGRGVADLNPSFYLGAESDEDEATGQSYFVNEFSETKDTCFTSIRIGQIEALKGSLYRVKLIKNCNGKIRNIELDNFPTLHEK